MKKISFQQDPGLSRDAVVLEGDRLKIVRKGMGIRAEQVVTLAEIDPGFETTRRRFKRLFLVPLVFAAAMLVAAWKLVHQSMISSELAIVPLMAFAMFLWYAVRGLKPIEITQVRDRHGKLLLELYQPRSSRLRYQEFVLTLNERVEKSGGQ